MLKGCRIDEPLAEDAGRNAVSEAEPLSANAFKTKLAANVVKRALLQAAGLENP
jgi:CO/xanthine dehydrogenase FAD-binding subunit